MPGRILLDTSILVALLRGDEAVTMRLREVDETFTSVVVLGELYYGARRSKEVGPNRARLDEVVADLPALSCDRLTAEAYGRLKDGLRAKGRPIPDNDLWVAATAVQHGLQLVARDDHFNDIDELDYQAW